MLNYFSQFPNDSYKKILLYDPEFIERKSINNIKEKLLLNKFKNDLNSLVEELKITESCYIHCIKSNENRSSKFFDNNFILAQIRHLGVYDTINLLQNEFCIKFSFKEFYSRYEDVVEFENKPFVYEIHEARFDIKELVLKTLKIIYPDYLNMKKQILIGKNSILMKKCFLNILDSIRRKFIWEKEKTVTQIATRFRSNQIRKVKLSLFSEKI